MWTGRCGQLLGSMNLAITLLVGIAVASVIGTVVIQNQPYTDYLIQFGPFWHGVFKSLGLYDVYGSIWFITLLGFLVISTSFCLYRNTPELLRGMRGYHVTVQLESLRHFRHAKEWTLSSQADVITEFGSLLRRYSYQWRTEESGQQTMLAAKKGAVGRLGYLFTHIAVVLICLGALFDSNIPLKVALATGKVMVEARPMTADEIPANSRLSTENMSFRATLDISEHATENLAYINYHDGYLVQPLPFTVTLDDFYMEHYTNGQPKSYASNLIIKDDSLEEPLHKTVSVNHPFNYKGYNIYQAGFGDGGSLLRFRAYPLNGSQLATTSLQGVVGEELVLDTGEGTLAMELMDFRLFNVKPMKQSVTGKKFTNLGPSFTFRLRKSDGMTRDYKNYMAAAEIGEHKYFISGVRENQNTPWQYLYIPVDTNGSINRFIQLANNSRDDEVLMRIQKQYAADSEVSDKALISKQLRLMRILMAIFNKGGYTALEKYLEHNVAAELRDETRSVYIKIIQQVLERVYLDILQTDRRINDQAMNKTKDAFFNAAMNALGYINQYGAPFYLQMTDFEHREASSLEITRSPGKNIVYLGCVLLLGGIFIMFYVPFRRIWIVVWSDNGRYRLLLAGAPHRPSSGFSQEFNTLQAEVGAHLCTTEQ